ncbi:MAG: DUF2795 domain-containing protein [Rhodospirillales bacterium]|nr:DUF2795 domain-containing protein [Rhodospirillales bacterium]
MTTEGHLPASLSDFVTGVAFPATPKELLAQARENGAHQGIIEVLQKLPDRHYDSVADLRSTFSLVE